MAYTQAHNIRQPNRSLVILAAILLAGVMVIVPLGGWILSQIGVGSPYPYLLVLGIVAGGYSLIVTAVQEFELGAFAALLVTMTIAADIPIGSEMFQLGSMGPRLWLFQIPLLGLLVCYLVASRDRSSQFSRSHVVFALFIAWSALGVFFGAGPHPEMVAYFVLFFIQAFLVFYLTTQLVGAGIVGYRSVLAVIALTIIGQALIGLAQFGTQSILGLSTLGASGARGGQVVVLETISLGPFGTWGIGAFVSGLTGGEPVAYLAAVITPIVLGLALTTRGKRRYGWLFTIPLLAFVIRASAWDAERGAFLVAVVSFAVFASIVSWGEFWERIMRDVPAVASLIAAIAFILYPTSRSGSTSKSRGTSTPALESGGDSGSSSEMANTVTQLSIPGFDLSHLSFRVEQWFISFDLWSTYPLFGIGGGNFWFVYTGYVSEPAMLHNMYLNILVETGTVGFLLYMLVLGSVLLVAVATIRNSVRVDWLTLGIIAGMMAYLTAAMLQVQFTRAPSLLTFWAIAGAVVGQHHWSVRCQTV